MFSCRVAGHCFTMVMSGLLGGFIESDFDGQRSSSSSKSRIAFSFVSLAADSTCSIGCSLLYLTVIQLKVK
jgi:hypothetical protein